MIHVLVTRPDPAGMELCREIERAGDKATYFPTIAFAPPPDISAMQQAIDTLDQVDWIIFVSRQAVIASVPLIRAKWPVLPNTVKFAAIGEKTARALAEAGYRVSVYPEQDWSTEGLMAEPAMQHVSGSKVSIVRGVGGRELAADILTERGAIVTHLIVYQRILPVIDSKIACQLIQSAAIDVIVCSSFQAVLNLTEMLGKDLWPALRATPLLVMSERIKKLAQDLDFQTIWVAHDTMQALQQLKMK